MRIGDAKLDKLAYLKRIRVFLDPLISCALILRRTAEFRRDPPMLLKL